MFKWIKKKLFEKVIKDLLKDLPILKDKALKLFNEKKELFIEKAKKALSKEFLELVKKL